MGFHWKLVVTLCDYKKVCFLVDIRGFKNCFSCPRRFQYIALNKISKMHSIYLHQFMGPGIVQVAHSYALQGHLTLFVTYVLLLL